MRGVLDNGLVVERERRVLPATDNAGPIGMRQAAAMAIEEFERWNRHGQVLRPGETPQLVRTGGMTSTAAPTVAQFVDDYLEFCASPNAGPRGANGPNTLENKEKALRLHLLPAFGSLRLDQIHRRDVDRYVRVKHKGGLSLGWIRGHLWCLRHMLSVAHRHELIEKVPDFSLPAAESSSIDALSTDEAKLFSQTLRERCSLRNQVLFELLMGAGLRVGEGLAVRPNCFELESKRPTVHVSESYSRRRLGGTKGGAPRLVPLPHSLAQLVRQYTRERGLSKNSSEFLFASPVNPSVPLSYEHVAELVQDLGEQIGLELHAHKLRHTFGTECARRGVPPLTIKEWMGHKDLKVTMGYVHMVAPDHLRWADLLDE